MLEEVEGGADEGGFAVGQAVSWEPGVVEGQRRELGVLGEDELGIAGGQGGVVVEEEGGDVGWGGGVRGEDRAFFFGRVSVVLLGGGLRGMR